MINVKIIKFCLGDDEQIEGQPRNTGHHLHSAHSLFPSSLCSAVIQIINLLDDAAVSSDGNAVYEVAYQVSSNFLIYLFYLITIYVYLGNMVLSC